MSIIQRAWQLIRDAVMADPPISRTAAYRELWRQHGGAAPAPQARPVEVLQRQPPDNPLMPFDSDLI